MEKITLRNVRMSYSDNVVFDDLNFEIEKGKITVVLGESGCGKTTLLRILAGLTEYDGNVQGMDGKIAFMFQENRLVPNLTVRQNLELVGINGDIEKELVEYGLKAKENQYPSALSGGMKRRVALLRTMIYDGDVTLLDEPFTNLDLGLKMSLIDKIKEKQKANGKTLVVVTHDIVEAVNLADRIIVLSNNNGQIKIVKDVSVVDESVEKELFNLLVSLRKKISD